jgi:tyrosyl-tRNA synthetase
MDGVPTASIERSALNNGYDLIQFLTDTAIFPSKGEAKKMLQAGGIAINKIKIASDKNIVELTDLLQNKYILVQKGKKNYYLVIVN